MSLVAVINVRGAATFVGAPNQVHRVTVVGVRGPQGAPGAGGGTAPVISTDPDNRAQHGTDGGVYVRDDLIPDPLAYYILAKA